MHQRATTANKHLGQYGSVMADTNMPIKHAILPLSTVLPQHLETPSTYHRLLWTWSVVRAFHIH